MPAGLRNRNEGAHVLKFGDLALFRAAERGHHVDGGVEIANRVVLPQDGLYQRILIGDEEFGCGSSAPTGDGAPPRQAGGEARGEQAQQEYGDRNMPEPHHLIVGSRQSGLSMIRAASLCYSDDHGWACGAVGSALPWHGRGREFESHQVHQIPQTLSNVTALGVRFWSPNGVQIWTPANEARAS